MYILFLVVIWLFACTPLSLMSLFINNFRYPRYAGDVIFEWSLMWRIGKNTTCIYSTQTINVQNVPLQSVITLILNFQRTLHDTGAYFQSWTQKHGNFCCKTFTWLYSVISKFNLYHSPVGRFVSFNAKISFIKPS